MEINKAFRYRIYPNKEQQNLMNRTFGSCRFVYNHFLNIWNET
ncbi:helix-turn-helix domain-containing protein, partial [Halalkalibacterium halodurans]